MAHDIQAFFVIAALAVSFLPSPADAATPMPTGAESHSFALHADGTVRGWGNDRRGEVSSGGGKNFILTPARVEGLPPIRVNSASFSAGNNHALAIAADGTVWGWGGNVAGQLGDGTNTDRTRPVRVSELSNAVAVATRLHSLAITAGGLVWTWGQGHRGELGGGDAEVRNRPRAIRLAGATAVSAGESHSLVLLADGSVYAFGDNAFGQIGDGTSMPRYSPVRVLGLSDVVAISAGTQHNLAVTRDGAVWSWGRNDEGQLGDGTRTTRRTPTRVPAFTAVVVAAGFGQASYAIREDGTVWRWGGSIGTAPRLVPAYGPAAGIAVGGAFSVAVRTDGGVFAEGNFGLGLYGSSPVAVAELARIAVVAAGRSSAYAVQLDGTVYAWGSNSDGQLGSGRTTLTRTTPGRMTFLQSIAQVAAAGSNLALRSDGSVIQWSHRLQGPETIQGLSGIVQIAAGVNHGVALRADGTVWTWGSNTFGQLGRGAFGGSISLPPAVVPGISGGLRVAAGPHHTVIVRSDGTVWTWGMNLSGNLGVPSTENCANSDGSAFHPCTPAPTQVPGLDSVIDVAAGSLHTLALRANGAVWAWGENHRGALGDGSTTFRRTAPAPVVGLADVIQVAAGGAFCPQGGCRGSASTALARDGTVWTWGDNTFGQLGDDTAAFRTTPSRVDGLSGISRISAGYRHMFALRSDGVLWAWGANNDGQIGDGTIAPRFKPVIVVREDGAGTIEGGDWFLDLDPGIGAAVIVDKAFLMVVEGSIGEIDANAAAQIRYRAADVGASGSVFVFALAPASSVQGGAVAMKSAQLPGVWAKANGKDTAVACVLAQLNASGQLVAVSAAAVQAYVSGVFSAQGQAVTILNGVPTVTIGGATFFVGYGPNAAAMINGGNNRSVATIPGALECRPQAPQTGWWWDPPPSAGARSPRDGTGYSIEAQGNLLFFAAFLYDASGRSSWYVASGRTSLDGSLFVGDLLQARGGQTLGGAYRNFSSVTNAGPITLAFNSATSGTMVWPGGTVPLGRFDIVPGGTSAAPRPNTPESGWWWNPAESGRGFFIEWQDGYADLAGYMYDEAGNPVWYITVVQTPDPMRLSGTWWSFGNGMTLMGPWQPHVRVNDNVAPVTITFTSATTATMTLPNGRITNLTRHRF